MGFDLSQYATVEERLALFWAAHPEGRVATTLIHYNEHSCLFRAEIYAHAADPVPVTVGHAYEEKTERGVNATSFYENAETSAVGRALANWTFSAGKRPSREEMAKVERMGGQPAHESRGPWQPSDAQKRLLYAMGHRGHIPASRTDFDALVEQLKQAKRT